MADRDLNFLNYRNFILGLFGDRLMERMMLQTMCVPVCARTSKLVRKGTSFRQLNLYARQDLKASL